MFYPPLNETVRIELSLPPHSLQLLHDIYDVVQIALKQLISSRACTQNEVPWQLPRAGFSVSMPHSHWYSIQKKTSQYTMKVCWSVFLNLMLSAWTPFSHQYLFLTMWMKPGVQTHVWAWSCRALNAPQILLQSVGPKFCHLLRKALPKMPVIFGKIQPISSHQTSVCTWKWSLVFNSAFSHLNGAGAIGAAILYLF